MAAVCPSHEVDELTVSLLNIFEARGLSFVLLEALIKQEIEETGGLRFAVVTRFRGSQFWLTTDAENESELLRRTCVATKMLSIYAKWKGAGYLKATLQNVVERLMLTSKDLSLELDPARVSSPEELQTNAEHLQIVARVFIENIVGSSSSIPTSFRKICSVVGCFSCHCGRV